MKRRVFTFLSAISFALLLLTIAIWIRSYFVLDRFYHWDDIRSDGPWPERAGNTLQIGPWTYWTTTTLEIGRGRIGLLRVTHGYNTVSPQELRQHILGVVRPKNRQTLPPAYPAFGHPIAGFDFSRKYTSASRADGMAHRGWGILLILPLWFIALILCIFPAVGTRRYFILHHRRKFGLCRRCGYDLRYHPPGDNCPECGTPIPAGAQP